MFFNNRKCCCQNNVEQDYDYNNMNMNACGCNPIIEQPIERCVERTLGI